MLIHVLKNCQLGFSLKIEMPLLNSTRNPFSSGRLSLGNFSSNSLLGHLYYRYIGLLEVVQSKQHHLQFSMGHNPDDLQNWQPSLLLNKTKSLNSWNSKIIRYFIIYGNLVDSPDRTSDELPKWHGHMQHCKKKSEKLSFLKIQNICMIFSRYTFSRGFLSASF